jgi:glycerophosphoryl diester phosphodiesterase
VAGKMTQSDRGASRPSVIAHRGASADHPENTIAAFRAAREQGADMVELDVRLAADDFLAVHHDALLVDGRPIAELAGPELPATVPSLAAALDACAGMDVNVELKSGPPASGGSLAVADEVVALVRARLDTAPVLVSSFDWAVIARVRTAAPEIATALLVVVPGDGVVDRVASAGHCALHPWFGAVTPSLIADCHAAGLVVNCWTCDEPARMVELATWRIDGICTNVPAVAREALRRSRHG